AGRPRLAVPGIVAADPAGAPKFVAGPAGAVGDTTLDLSQAADARIVSETTRIERSILGISKPSFLPGCGSRHACRRSKAYTARPCSTALPRAAYSRASGTTFDGCRNPLRQP